MPALVGGFGNKCSILFFKSNKISWFNKESTSSEVNKKMLLTSKNQNFKNENSNLGPYLAGLIEGDGTFAIHDTKSTAKKYRPMIIIVFKLADLPLAEYLQELTNCGTVYKKSDRGYVLWQIQDIIGVYTIVNIINGYMRTPKIEALNRTINWLNGYISVNNNSKLPSTKLILSQIKNLEIKGLDNSPIDSNPWLSGFTDADGHFSINIHKRTNRNSIRVQLFYRLEIRQSYHRFTHECSDAHVMNAMGDILNDDTLMRGSYNGHVENDNENVAAFSYNASVPAGTVDNEGGGQVSFFAIMSKIANYLNTSVLSRSRTVSDKQFFSFIVMSASKSSLIKTTLYFNKFPLLSSKFLDYKSWLHILELQQNSTMTTAYLNEAIKTKTDFNKTRTTFSWNHLKNCYLTK